MWALQVPGYITWDPALVTASIIFGIVFGMGALATAIRRDEIGATLIAAVLLTLAIVSHHFTAMGAVEIVPDPTRLIDAFSLSPTMLALAIAGVAIAVLGMSLAGAFADRRLREKDVLLATALNNMAHGLLMFDREKRLILYNSRYVEMSGLSPDQVKPGATLRDTLMHRKEVGSFFGDVDEYRATLDAAIAKGKTTSTVQNTADGRTIHTVSRPMPDLGWVATYEDVTERISARLLSARVRDGSAAFSESLISQAFLPSLHLSSAAAVRYNPAQVLGHMLGQSDGAQNQPTEREGGSHDHHPRPPR